MARPNVAANHTRQLAARTAQLKRCAAVGSVEREIGCVGDGCIDDMQIDKRWLRVHGMLQAI